VRAGMRCGENSLQIYCLGVLLVLASHVALLDISDGLAMQIALSLGGILAMIVAAILLNSIRIKPRQQPRRDATREHDDFGFARSVNFEEGNAFFVREGSELSQLVCIEGQQTSQPPYVRPKESDIVSAVSEVLLGRSETVGGRHATDCGLARQTWPRAIRAALCRERH